MRRTMITRMMSFCLLAVAGCGTTPSTIDAGAPDAFETLDAGRDAGSDGGTSEVDAFGLDAFGLDAFALDAGTDAFAAPDASFDVGPIDRMGGPTCATSPTVGAGVYTGRTFGAGADYQGGTNCVGQDGIDVVYAVSVLPGRAITASVASGDGSFDPSINLVAGPAAQCDATPIVCLDGDDHGDATTVNTATWANRGTAPATVFAIVDNFSASTLGGPYTLTLALDALPPPAPGDVCGIALPATATQTGTTVGAFDDYHAGDRCAGTMGPDVAYEVGVPAGQSVTLTVTPVDAAYDPSIALVGADCGGVPHACLAGADAAGAGAAESLSWTNPDASAATVYAIVDGAVGGAFTLEVTITP